jgi:hypothetical protein
MNVHIGVRQDPQPLMLQLQAYREEFFAASGAERDEARLPADLKLRVARRRVVVGASLPYTFPLVDLNPEGSRTQMSS